MIVRVARALCVLVVAGSWVVLAPVVSATKTTSAGGPSTAPSRDPYRHPSHPRGTRSRLDLPARARLAHPGRARAAIVGGIQIPIGQAPWQVAVKATISGGGGTLCGGSILDAAHVLTAAHCVFDSKTATLIPPEDFTVYAGTSDLASQAEPAEQELAVTNVRPHPYYVYTPDSGHVNPDDIAVLTLERPLVLGPDVSPIFMVSAGPSLIEGTAVDLTGFGVENPVTEELNGKLYSLAMTLGYSRECAGENDAVLLCGSAPSGSPCNGDSGSALTLGAPAMLAGVEDDYFLVSGKKCNPGAENAFANVAAPEIQDFLDGSETPPRAPRGGGAVIFERPINDGSMGCEPGRWSESPTFTYTFQDTTDGQILQQGASSTYTVPATEVGHKILCQVQAANAGGTGIGRTPGLLATAAAPVPPQPSPAVEGTTPPTSPTPAPGEVSLAGTQITVQSSGLAAVRLTCTGAGTCSGKLMLTATSTTTAGKGPAAKGEKKRSKTTTIGTVTFSIPTGKTVTITLHLDAAGRALLKAAHGRLSASLTIIEYSEGSKRARHESIHLVLRKVHVKR
jgi:Trypsin